MQGVIWFVLTEAATYLVIWKVRGKVAMMSHRAENFRIGLYVWLIVMGCVYGPIFGWHVFKAIYDDHQHLVEEVKVLPVKDREIKRLHDKLNDTCYRPERHYTQAQYDAINSSLSTLAVKYRHPRIDFGMFWCSWKGSTCDYEAHDFMGSHSGTVQEVRMGLSDGSP